jgi:hypothetical protein
VGLAKWGTRFDFAALVATASADDTVAAQHNQFAAASEQQVRVK